MDVIRNFVETIKEGIKEQERFFVNVSVECDAINLQNMHDLEVTNIEETQDKIELETTLGNNFIIGKNYKDVNYNEYTCGTDYTFRYDNDLKMCVMVN